MKDSSSEQQCERIAFDMHWKQEGGIDYAHETKFRLQIQTIVYQMYIKSMSKCYAQQSEKVKG